LWKIGGNIFFVEIVPTTTLLLTFKINPDGEDKPNKKYYDPRKWLRDW